MENFFAHNNQVREEMLKEINVSSIEDLFSEIPQKARMATLDLPDALGEMEVQKSVKSLSKKNNTDKACFVGAGIYNHFIPACVSQVAGRYEFLTAYTPYQPEIAQGTLQVIYEYQSMICNLTGMDVSNACVYDGASACAEAILMATRITKRRKAIVSNSLNPQFKTVIDTYTHANGIEVKYAEYSEILDLAKTQEYSCVLVQNPDFYGALNEFDFAQNLKDSNTLFVISSEASALSVLKSQRELGADIAIGDIQSLGLPMSFGGPHAGYMACVEKYLRQLPGRIVGKTVDADGNDAYTLTLQTREQHIRREKATSNICSNQSLMALCSTLYLSLLGKKGFKQVGIKSAENAHMLAQKLADKGIKVLTKDFYNEFVIEVENSDNFLAELDAKNIMGGLKLDDRCILVAATEMNTKEEIDAYVS